MGSKARASLTVALGVALGLRVWLNAESESPSRVVGEPIQSIVGVAFLLLLVVVPLIVGRWWVVAALGGGVGALTILKLTGQTIYDTDGYSDPLSRLSFIGLAIFGLLMLALVGIRLVFDRWRARRLARPAVVDSV
jgi:hypothetical protein